MSYDYNALVQTIAKERRLAEKAADNNNNNTTTETSLQHSMAACDAFETLSTHCPMTPLLWMQYAATTRQLLVQSSNNDNDDNDDTSMIAIADALAAQCNVLELALQEFPGSALLQLYNCSVARQVSAQEERRAIEAAIFQVGRNSHLQEDYLIERLYQRQLELAKEPSSQGEGDNDNAVMQSLLQRSRVLLESNQSLSHYATELLLDSSPASIKNKEQVAHLMTIMEDNRRIAARLYNTEIVSHAEQVELDMHSLGILAKHQLPILLSEEDDSSSSNSNNIIDWDTLLQSKDQQYGMGLGDRTVAHAFIQMALAVQKRIVELREERKREQDDDDDNDSDGSDDDDHNNATTSIPYDLPICIYERAVAECPTVESLWLSFIRHVTELLQDHRNITPQQTTFLAEKLQSITRRAVRNCPYSLALLQQQLQSCFVLTRVGVHVLDPETLMTMVQTALEEGFLAADWQFLQAYLSAIRVMKQRILFVLMPSNTLEYDDAEPIPKKKATAKTSAVTDDAIQEAHDLMEDLADMYDEVETRLKQSHKSWTAGRSQLWKDRALTCQWLMDPLQRIKNMQNELTKSMPTNNKGHLHWFEKALRTSKSPHPDSYRSYIASFAADDAGMNNEADVTRRIRQVRYLYQQAIGSVERPKGTEYAAAVQQQQNPFEAIFLRDFDTAFSNLCHEFLEFERIVGTDKSIGRATRAIQKKMRHLRLHGTTAHSQAHTTSALISAGAMDEDKSASGNGTSLKRKTSEDKSQQGERATKKARVDADTKHEESTEVANENTTKAEAHKVLVGNLEYPAHPYTVKISFLHPSTEDIDLVDLLRPKCGPIAHARIVRDKHPPHKSKGWALVQFEEKESVEKALALDDVIGLHEKVLRIERSHLPAISLVPPGRHKVSEKGQGKHSKRNEKKKEQVAPVAGEDKDTKPAAVAPKEETDEKPVEKPADDHDSKLSLSAPVPGLSALAFQPRGVARKSHQKARLQLDKK